jgi:hypothetical protein
VDLEFRRSYRPWRVAEGAELPPAGLTPDERRAIAGLFRGGWRVSRLRALYGITPQQLAEVVRTTHLPYTKRRP